MNLFEINSKRIWYLCIGAVLDIFFSILLVPKDIELGPFYPIPMIYVGICICSVHCAIIPNLINFSGRLSLLRMAVGVPASFLYTYITASIMVVAAVPFAILVIFLFNHINTNWVILNFICSLIAANACILTGRSLQAYPKSDPLEFSASFFIAASLCAALSFSTLQLLRLTPSHSIYWLATALGGIPLTYLEFIKPKHLEPNEEPESSSFEIEDN